MLQSNKHILKTTVGLLIVAASFFCVLFGQGAHLHDLNIHISSHLDVHAHLHAHASHDEPVRADHQEENTHQHEVNTATDIIGTLTSPCQLWPDIQSQVVFLLDDRSPTVSPKFQQVSTLFDLPPPRTQAYQYYCSSLSRRGPPIA